MEKNLKSQKKSSKSKIEKVQKKFENWRATKRTRNIPEELWQAAVELYPEYKISKIAVILGLNHSKLKKKISESKTRKENDQDRPKKESKRESSNNGQQATIEQIKRELEDFRKNSKKKRSRIPESIWQAAVDLSLESNPRQIARTIGLDYRSLMKRLNLSEKNASKTATTSRDSTTSLSPIALKDSISPKGPPAFIQLDIPSPPKPIEPDQNEWSIEMENADGAKMKIGVKSTQMLDIAVICQNFLRG